MGSSNSGSDSTGSNMNSGSTGSNMGGSSTSTDSMGGMQDKISSTVDGVMQRVRDTTDQAREYLTDKMGNVQEQFSGVSDSVTQGVDRIRQMDREDYEQAWQSVKTRASQNPGQTILISAAVGLVLGMMMRGGRRY
jgi:ElaB/YqjD/DUF883 family membrane-anchored ribosome-binding protein